MMSSRGRVSLRRRLMGSGTGFRAGRRSWSLFCGCRLGMRFLRAVLLLVCLMLFRLRVCLTLLMMLLWILLPGRRCVRLMLWILTLCNRLSGVIGRLVILISSMLMRLLLTWSLRSIVLRCLVFWLCLRLGCMVTNRGVSDRVVMASIRLLNRLMLYWWMVLYLARMILMCILRRRRRWVMR